MEAKELFEKLRGKKVQIDHSLTQKVEVEVVGYTKFSDWLIVRLPAEVFGWSQLEEDDVILVEGDPNYQYITEGDLPNE